MKVLIVVTHLLGTGHLARALVLARAVQDAGDQALVVSGGLPVSHLDRGDVPLVQLPALRSDGVDFARLLDGDGQVAGEDLHAARRKLLRDTLADYQPDVLLSELFPFGRRVLKGEFIDLLHTAKGMQNPPLICASIRDILAPPSKPAKAAFAQDQIDLHYDAVLVHSDAEITPLSLSWPLTDALASKLHYTGFVAPSVPAPHPDSLGQDEVLVTAGGGDVGAALFATALDAAALMPAQRWRLLVGPANQQKTLRAKAPANVIVEPTRPDFRAMLHHAKASVSMCGYNTALDLLQTGCPALFVPFDAGGEVEQTLRATALAQRAGLEMLTAQDMTAQTMSDALTRLIAAPRPTPIRDGFDGANTSARLLRTLWEARI